MDKDIGTKLLDYIKEVESRTLEHYKKAEGISARSVSLPGVNITVKDE